jgi:hypothetical protein
MRTPGNPIERPRWRFLAPTPHAAVQPGARPSFTVLIPAYEAADVICGAVSSALAQTVPAEQVLVVDDGSSDDLAGALVPFGEAVELVRITHAGPSAARNAGLRHARGDFVAFLDADDSFEPEFLAAIGELAITRPDLDVLTTDATFVVDGRPRGTFHQANPFPVQDQRAAVLQRCFITTKSAVRRSRLAEIGGFDPRLSHGEDWDCWIRLVVSGSRVGMVDAPLSGYRLDDRQMSARRGESLRGRYTVMASLLDRPDLTEAERRDVAARLPALRLRAAVAAAREAGRDTVRRRGWDVARLPEASWRLRAAAVAGAAAPGLAPFMRRLDSPRARR